MISTRVRDWTSISNGIKHVSLRKQTCVSLQTQCCRATTIALEHPKPAWCLNCSSQFKFPLKSDLTHACMCVWGTKKRKNSSLSVMAGRDNQATMTMNPHYHKDDRHWWSDVKLENVHRVWTSTYAVWLSLYQKTYTRQEGRSRLPLRQINLALWRL